MPQESIIRQELEEKRSFWSSHIASWQAGRLSQREYCRRHELRFHQFVYWRRKFAPKATVPVSLVQVPVATLAAATGCSPFPAALRVSLAPDVAIEVFPGFNQATLQQLVCALREIR